MRRRGYGADGDVTEGNLSPGGRLDPLEEWGRRRAH